MHTEDEAAGKICKQGDGGNCLGSKCMHWRWNGRQTVGEYKGRPENREGYCGLAGKVE